MIKLQKILICGLLAPLVIVNATGQGFTESPAVGQPISGKFKILTNEIYPTTDHHITDKDLAPGLHTWKQRISGDLGIDFILLSAPIAQAGTVGGATYLDNEVDLYFQWRLFEGDDHYGKFFFWGLWGQTLSSKTTGEFTASQGLITQPNLGGTDPKDYFISPSALWWEQKLRQTPITFRLGQLYAPALWGSSQHYGDDRETFLNSTVSSTQGLPWANASRGLGAMATYDVGEFYLSGGFQDAQANQQRIDFSSFSEARYVYLSEFGYTPNRGGAYASTYKITLGYVDKTNISTSNAIDSGWGIVLNFEQKIKDDFAIFGVHRHSFERYIGNIESTSALGFTFPEIGAWADDQLSIAAFLARPKDTLNNTRRNEWGLEAYWRVQATPRLDVTPDLQVYFQPGNQAQSGPVAIFGLRLRYML